jgi:hypothetical protein
LRLAVCERGADRRRKRYGHSSAPSSDAGVGPGDRSAHARDSQVCLQLAADRAASKHLGDSRNLGQEGLLADPAGRPHGRRHCDARVWRQGGRCRLPRVQPCLCVRVGIAGDGVGVAASGPISVMRCAVFRRLRSLSSREQNRRGPDERPLGPLGAGGRSSGERSAPST